MKLQGNHRRGSHSFELINSIVKHLRREFPLSPIRCECCLHKHITDKVIGVLSRRRSESYRRGYIFIWSRGFAVQAKIRFKEDQMHLAEGRGRIYLDGQTLCLLQMLRENIKWLFINVRDSRRYGSPRSSISQMLLCSLGTNKYKIIDNNWPSAVAGAATIQCSDKDFLKNSAETLSLSALCGLGKYAL